METGSVSAATGRIQLVPLMRKGEGFLDYVVLCICLTDILLYSRIFFHADVGSVGIYIKLWHLHKHEESACCFSYMKKILLNLQGEKLCLCLNR